MQLLYWKIIFIIDDKSNSQSNNLIRRILCNQRFIMPDTTYTMAAPLLSVVVPVFNEEVLIPELCRRLASALELTGSAYEIILVNDGSTDGTQTVIQQECLRNDALRYICFSRNFGHQSAVSAGIDFAKGDSLVIIDGDLQDPPELIGQLYAKMQEGFHVVYAKRTKRKGENAIKRFMAALYYRVLKSMTAVEIPLDTGDFRIISRTVIDHLKTMNEYNKFLRGQVAWVGYKQTSIEYERDTRTAGASKYSFLNMMKLGVDGITGFSDFPLKVPAALGLLFSLLAFILLALLVVFRFFFHRTLPGWYWLGDAILLIGGIQFICIGILAAYISRISSNSNQRPLYIIDKSNL